MGAWLPNPYYHLQRNTQAEAKDDDIPAQEGDRNPVPRIRRITYYAREVLRIHPIKDRFVYVTDGGHYENLGLVELFRRQCTEIISVDASGDRGLPRALSDAVALAYEELGVVVRIEGFSLAEHSAEDGTEANEELRDLESRMTTSSVLVGEYWYPWMDHDERGHRLVIGKARLGQDLAQEPLMFPLQSYATSHPDFPSDSTGDQWFEVDQFQAYLMLGQLVGAAMSAQLEQPWPPSEPPV